MHSQEKIDISLIQLGRLHTVWSVVCNVSYGISHFVCEWRKSVNTSVASEDPDRLKMSDVHDEADVVSLES